MIEVNSLTKRFVNTVAVDNISFTIQKGEVVGFLGPNGAGKTTTMRILTCFMPPSEGTAKIAGLDIYENSLEIRKKIGYLPESAPLYLDIGVLDYLYYIAEIRQIPSAQRKKSIEEVIECCGLQSVLGKDVYELSKGYRQRLGLALALIHKPDIMILDEPTSGLDPKQIIEIRNLIKEIGREKTVLLSTHILPEVEATCDRMIIINKGKIVAQGTTEELSSLAQQKDNVLISLKAEREEIEKKLKENPAIVSFNFLQTNNGIHRFSIKSKEENICEQLYKLAVQQNWILTELYKESASLEDVFLQLTTEENR